MLKSISYLQLRNFFCYVLIVALIYSPFLLSLSMVGLMVLAVFKIEYKEGKLQAQLNRDGFKRIRNIKHYPVFAVLFLFAFVALFRAYPIEELDYLLTRLRIKVPFITLVLAFLALPAISKKDFKNFFYFLLLVITLTDLGILFNYFKDFENYNQLMAQGHHIPTPRDHIRYSLFSALSVVGGAFLLIKQHYIYHKNEKWLIAFAAVFVFLFMHFLSVKSGLLVIYTCIAFGLLQYIIIRKQLLAGAIGLLLLCAIPIVALQTFPTFKNKIGYFQYDLQMYLKGEGANYSDSGRLASLDAGWHIAKDNWLWGVGTANIRKSVREHFETHFPNYPEVFMPQNQFLFAWGATGIFGLLLTLFAFFYPLFYKKNYKYWFFTNFYLSILVIISIEHALENAVGVAHYLFFLLLFLSMLNRTDIEPNRP